MMDVGLLWYDGDPKRPLEDKIGRAARRYRDKYGRWPNTCYVHPQAVNGQAGQELRPLNARATIRLLAAPNILLHHFWLGESNDQAAARRREPVN
jgi:hypothetical protein